MSKMRPEMDRWTGVASYSPDTTTGYLMVYNAVKQRKGLIAGRLEAHGEFCAIGSYFHVNKGCGLKSEVVDDVAAVNDSFKGSESARRTHMLRWLRWKLGTLNMPGFVAAAKNKP